MMRSRVWGLSNDLRRLGSSTTFPGGYGPSMGRLPLVDSEDPGATPFARDVLRATVGAGSIQPNVYRAMANHPQALEALAHFGSVVYFHNSLTPTQRELAYLTASVTNDCHY